MITVLQLCLFKNSLCILNISFYTQSHAHTHIYMHSCTYTVSHMLSSHMHTHSLIHYLTSTLIHIHILTLTHTTQFFMHTKYIYTLIHSYS